MTKNVIGRTYPTLSPEQKRERGRRAAARFEHPGPRKQDRMLRDVKRDIKKAVPKRVQEPIPGVTLNAHQLVEMARSEFGTQMAAANYLGPKWAKQVLDRIGKGASKGQSTCLQIFARVMGWTSQGIQHQTLILARIGAVSEQEAQDAIGLLRQVQNVDEDAAAESAVNMLMGYLDRHPERRDDIVAKLSENVRTLVVAEAEPAEGEAQ
jgi:hypothetical protein